MKRFLPTFLICALLLMSCKVDNPELKFANLYVLHTEAKAALLPEFGVAAEINSLEVPTVERFEKTKNQFTKTLTALEEIDVVKLNNILDQAAYEDMQRGINNKLQFLNEETYHWDPSFYNVCGQLKRKLSISKYSTCERLEFIHHDLEKIPAYYEVAKNNIKKPSIKKTLLAIEKNSLGFKFLKHELMDSLNSTACTQFEKEKFVKEMDNSLIAIKDYVAFCNSLKFEYGEKNSEIVFRDSL